MSKVFGPLTAVDRIDLKIMEGEFFTIVGPSGSGKTTLVRILAGMETASSGDIRLRGKRINDIPANRRPTCMVFQSLALFPHRSVGDNIEFSLKIRGIDRSTRRARALELMQQLRLPEGYYGRSVRNAPAANASASHLPGRLPSTPRSCSSTSRSLPSITSSARPSRRSSRTFIETGKTFVYITHSLEEAMVMSDRIGVMRVEVGAGRNAA